MYAGDEAIVFGRRECQAFPFFIKGLHRQPALDDSFMHNADVGAHAFELLGPKTGAARTAETIGCSVAMQCQIAPDRSAAQRLVMQLINARAISRCAMWLEPSTHTCLTG